MNTCEVRRFRLQALRGLGVEGLRGLRFRGLGVYGPYAALKCQPVQEHLAARRLGTLIAVPVRLR